MDTQNTETTQVDPEKDISIDQTTEGEKVEETKVEETEEDEQEIPNEWQEKFNKQSASAQRKITETNEKLFEAHRKLANSSPSHILELSKGDDKEIKIAKNLAKEIYNLSLSEVIEGLKPEEESKEDIEKRLRSEIERETNKKASYNLYIKSHTVLDESSSDYDENIKQQFDQKLERLMDKDIMTLEETSNVLEDAFYLSTRGGTNPERSQLSIATAGSSGSTTHIKATPSRLFTEIDESLAACGISPISDEAKKLIKQGKL